MIEDISVHLEDLPINYNFGYYFLLGSDVQWRWNIYANPRSEEIEPVEVDVLVELYDKSWTLVDQATETVTLDGFETRGYYTPPFTADWEPDLYRFKVTVDPGNLFPEDWAANNSALKELLLIDEYSINARLSAIEDVARQDAVAYVGGDSLAVWVRLDNITEIQTFSLFNTPYVLVLSDDNVFDADDLVFSADNLGDVLGTYDYNRIEFSLPLGLDPGTYKLGLKIDYDAEIFAGTGVTLPGASEFAAWRNIEVTDAPSGLGYETTGFIEGPYFRNGGIVIPALFTFDTNIVPAAPEDVEVLVVHSLDGLYGPDDTVVFSGTLGDFNWFSGFSDRIGDGTSYTLNMPVELPDNASDGVFGLILDPEEQILTRSSNAFDFTTVYTQLTPNFDLFVKPIFGSSFGEQAGNYLSFSFAFTNTGFIPLGEDAIALELWRQVDGAWVRTKVYEGEVPSASGGISYWTINLKDSQEPVLPGEYTARMVMDPYDKYAEVNESNNWRDFAITVEHHTRSDFDGNGFDDVLFFNASRGAIGQFTMPEATWSGLGMAGVGWKAVGTGRIVADDVSDDVLWFNEETGRLGVFDMDRGTADWMGLTTLGPDWVIAAVADLNGDTLTDILLFDDATYRVGFIDSSSGAQEVVEIGQAGRDWMIAAVADLTGDGIEDIVWQNAQTDAIGYFKMRSDGGYDWNLIGADNADGRIIAAGDFFGWGAEDLLLQEEGTGRLTILDFDEPYIRPTPSGFAGLGWEAQGVADFNGDFVDDVLWRHDDGRLGMFEMEQGVANWETLGFAGSDWDVIL